MSDSSSVPSRRFPWSRGSSGGGDPNSQLLATLRGLSTELGDSEQRIDEGLETAKLPGRLLQTRAWDRSKGQLRGTEGMGPLFDDLESAYAEVKRVNMIRTGRLMKAYSMEPGDGVEDALTTIRHALDALESSVAMLGGSDRIT